MPTYVYECSACSDVFEVEQRITEDALKDCHCGSKGSVKRLIQPVGISFKGSGFYVNDSGTSNQPAAKKEKVEDTPIPDSKPAAPTESTVTSE